MKKYLSIILINVMAITLSGCGSSGDTGCCSDSSVNSETNEININKNTNTVVADLTDYASTPLLNSVNSVPFATFDHFVTGVNVAYCGQLTAKDDDHDTLSFQVQNKPSHGTLEVDASGAFTYVPNVGYEGSDSFSYTASDDVSTSQNKNVAISVEGVDKGVPYAPSDLKLDINSKCSIDVAWTDNSDNEDRFNIYVDDEFVKSVDGSDEGASIIETTLCTHVDHGSKYEVKVEAANEAGPSESISQKITIGSASDKVDCPTDFHVKSKNCDSIRFGWDHVEEATGYEIYQDGKLVKEFSYYPKGGMVINNLVAGKQYTFELIAVANDDVKSDPVILQESLDKD